MDIEDKKEKMEEFKGKKERLMVDVDFNVNDWRRNLIGINRKWKENNSIIKGRVDDEGFSRLKGR